MHLREWSSDEDEVETAIKVVIVGNGNVGKSSLIQRYCRGTFSHTYRKTIGVDFLEKHVRVDGEVVRLMLWDTAGQEEFDAITKAYYRGAQACVIAFSTVDRASFENVLNWKHKVENECGQVPTVLVQNKIDKVFSSQVSREEAERLARALDMRLYCTSVKEDVNVANVFEHLARDHVHHVLRTLMMRESRLGHAQFGLDAHRFSHFERRDWPQYPVTALAEEMRRRREAWMQATAFQVAPTIRLGTGMRLGSRQGVRGRTKQLVANKCRVT